MESLKIVGLCILSAVVYGILHDLVTANLCVEYFSVFHPPVFNTESPWLLALGWGVIATWWMGLFLGLMIAAASQAGELPKFGWRRLVRPLVVVLAVSYVAALVAGLIGYHVVRVIPDVAMTTRVAAAHFGPEKQRAFTADLLAHNASYSVSALGALVTCAWIVWRRLHEPRLLITGQRPI